MEDILDCMELDDEVFAAELQHQSMVRRFPEGAVLLREGDPVGVLPIVITGSVRVFQRDQDGREILLYYIRPGESCVMSFLAGLGDRISKVNAEVEDEARTLLAPIDQVREWTTKYPAWNQFIFRLYDKRFQELVSLVNAIAFTQTDQRLESWLRHRAAMTGLRELAVTHQQIADELGTAREVVSRLLKQLERQNKVTLGRNKIRLEDSFV